MSPGDARESRDVPEAVARALAAVEPVDPAWSDRAGARLARLPLPAGSLGRLVGLARQLAAVQRTERPVGHPALVAVFAADHGVVEAGVTTYPPETTGRLVANSLRGGAAVNVLARRVGAEVRVADLGLRAWAGLEGPSAQPPHLYDRSIRAGTSNLLEGPAMTRAEAFRAFRVGLDLGDRWAGDEGFRVVALGDMGVGNSTTAAALIAALTDAPAETVVGPGSGVSGATLEHKRSVVARAVAAQRSAGGDLWDLLATLGGFELLGLAGLAVAVARRRGIVVLDGLVSACSGLVAARVCPASAGAFVAGHRSPEPGHAVALGALGLTPLLDLEIRVGEGTGAALALPLLAAAADLLRDTTTSDDAHVARPATA